MNKTLLISLLFLFSAALYNVAGAQNTIQSINKSRLNNNTSSSSSSSNFPITDEDNPDTVANDLPKGIVYDDKTLPDSVLRSHVFSFPATYRAVKIRNLQHPSLIPTGAQSNDPIGAVGQYYYASLGALGQAHLPLFYHSSTQVRPRPRGHSSIQASKHPSINTFTSDPFPLYHQYLHINRFYQTQTPYTLLGYGSSLDKDYQIHVIHTQNIRPRWNVAMLYDLVSRDGLYTNSGVTNHILDITTNYYSQDARYQLQAAFSLNRIRQEENGGVTNDITCWSYSRESGIPVNMYSAQNQWRDIELSIHQSFNTVRQFDIIREWSDTIVETPADSLHKAKFKINTIHDTTPAPKPSTFNTGVFALDLSYSRHRRIFADNQANSWFYNYGSLDTTFIYDSTAHHQLAAELYWTNDAHMSHKWVNPIVITGGIRPQYDELRFAKPDSKMSELNVTPFASARLNIGRLNIQASAEETNGSRRLGDYRLDGNLSLQMGTGSTAQVSILSEAQSPSMIYYHNEGVYNWDIDDFNKIKQQRISAQYSFNGNKRTHSAEDSSYVQSHSQFKIHNSKIALSSTLISDNVWFDSQMRPTQGDASAMLLQADLSGHFQLGWLNLRTHQMLQYTSNDDMVRVPLFASNNSLFADFTLFRKALRAQIGVDLRYHTKFYCDGWNPVLGAFYRQDDVKVGNYLIADLWLTLQIKRATIYLRASHLNAPIEKLAGLQPSYFSLPHYPYENFTLYWGLTWRFFD